MVIFMASEIDLSPYIDKFEEFYSVALQDKISHLLVQYPMQKSLMVDYGELERYDPSLADLLIKQPDTLTAAAEQALIAGHEVSFKTAHPEAAFEPHVRFYNLPDTGLLVQDIGSKLIREMISVKGVVTKRAEMKHKVKIAVYKCQMCDATMKVPMTKSALVPQVCDSCKRRALKLEEDESYFVDMQWGQVQELLERLKGSAPAATINILLEDDLVNSVTPGETVEITAIMRIHPETKGKGKADSVQIYQRYLDVIHIAKTQKEFDELSTSREEEQEIRNFAKDEHLYEKMRESVSPGIYGHNEVKEALVLQLFGGTKDKHMAGGAPIRNDIHILLIGDPGAAKTRFLQSMCTVAPKAIYVSGKSVTGVGLTASAEKDELGDGGWTLKAGALVIASGGIAGVDEFDKIDDNERAAMHEVMESQSYHYDTELMFADGRTSKIGDFVEALFRKYPARIEKGKDCLILQPPEDHEVLTTDFKRLFKTKISRVSKHTAPEKFVRVTLQTGRQLLVTPEHPFWILEEGDWKVVAAENLREGMFVPMPKQLPLFQSAQLPLHYQSPEFFRLLGYYITDGSYELNRGIKNGINFSNKNSELIDDFSELTHSVFGVDCYVQSRDNGVMAARAISMPVARQLSSIDSHLLDKGSTRAIPEQMMAAPLPLIKELLSAIFEGDGSFSKNTISLVSPNRAFICQVQLLLLRFQIRSHVFADGSVFRITVNGQNNLSIFLERIGFISERKQGRLKEYAGRKKKLRTVTDVVPSCIGSAMELLRTLKIKETEAMGAVLYAQKQGFNFSTRNFMRILTAARKKLALFNEKLAEASSAGDFASIIRIRKGLSLSQQDIAGTDGNLRHLISYYELRMQKWAFEKYRRLLIDCIRSRAASVGPLLSKLEGLLSGEVGWCRVKRVEAVNNADSEWVYDATVEPTHAFVSECAILHNTVSVAKAGIVAKFKAKTAILAAANPKYSRFDETKLPGEQFNIPPTILSRFDLIFPILDVMDAEKDSRLAQYMLDTHKSAAEHGESQIQSSEIHTVPVEFLRKYVSYARRTVKPILSQEASDKIKDFYVKLREKGKADRAVPITPRQIEGLIRMSEASAKIRLSNVVEASDAERAIKLTEYVLSQVSTDRATGKIDSDILMTGRPRTAQLDKINAVLGIVKKLQQQLGAAEISRVIEEATGEGIDEITGRRIIDDLIYRSELYKVRPGFVKVVEQSG